MKNLSSTTVFTSIRQRPLLALYCLGILFFVYAPLAALVGISFQGGPSFFHWYEVAFGDPQLIIALKNSLLIGLGTMVLSTGLGLCAALALRSKAFPGSGWGKAWFESVLNLPMVLPEIVLGLALLVWFVFLKISLGLVSVTLAHTTFTFSYVTLILLARLRALDPTLDEASADLGGTPWKTFIKVTFPLLLPALVSGGLLAFTLSFDDFLITFFTAGVGSDTLPVRIYSMMRFGITPEINAISSSLVFVTLLASLLIFKLR